jgi:hypothetical protein
MASKTESTLIGGSDGGGSDGADTGKVVAEVCGTADAADDEEDAVATEAVDVKSDGARAAAVDDDADDENGDCIGAPLKAGAFETPEKGRLSPTDGVDGANDLGVGVFIDGSMVDAVDEEGTGAVNGDAAGGACLCPKAGVLNTTGTADAGMVFAAVLTGVVTAVAVAAAARVCGNEGACSGCGGGGGCGGANGDGVRAVAEKALRAADGVSDVVGSAAAEEVDAEAGANVDADTDAAAEVAAAVDADVDDEDEV